MAVTVRNILLFVFCTGSLAASIPEGITLVSSDKHSIIDRLEEHVAGVGVNIPRVSTEAEFLPVTTKYLVEQGSGVGDEPLSGVTPASGQFDSGMPVIPGTMAVSSGPYKVVEQAEKSLAAKLHAWLAGLIPHRATSHLPEAHVASGVFAGVSISDSTDEDSEGDYLVAGLSNYLDGAVYFALTEIDERNVMVSDTGCGYCAGNKTAAFLSAVTAKLDLFCSAKSVKFPFFCQYFKVMKRITVLTLLKNLDLIPIKLGVLRCAAAGGPCHPNNPSTKQMKHFMRAMCRFVHKKLKDSRGPHSLVVDNFVSLALQKSMPPRLEVEAGSCSSCINLGVDLYKAAVFQMMESTCANARCRHVQAACKFGREHPFLMDLAVTRKLDLWGKVAAACTLSNHCPAVKGNLSDPSTLSAFRILPKVGKFGDSVKNWRTFVAVEGTSEKGTSESWVVLGGGSDGGRKGAYEEWYELKKGKKWEAEEHGGDDEHERKKVNGGVGEHKQHKQHRLHEQMHMHTHGEGHEEEEGHGFGSRQHKRMHKHMHMHKLRHGNEQEHEVEEEKEKEGEKEEEGEREGQFEAARESTAKTILLISEMTQNKMGEEEGVKMSSHEGSTSQTTHPEIITVGHHHVKSGDKKKRNKLGRAHGCSRLHGNGGNANSILCGPKHERKRLNPEKEDGSEGGAGWEVKAHKVVGSMKRAAGQVSSAVRGWGGQVQTAVTGAIKGEAIGYGDLGTNCCRMCISFTNVFRKEGEKLCCDRCCDQA